MGVKINHLFFSFVFVAVQVQTYLDYFDYVQSNQGSMYTPHAQLLAKRQCKTTDQFFKEHANTFKPRA